jgi:hypothetical protein
LGFFDINSLGQHMFFSLSYIVIAWRWLTASSSAAVRSERSERSTVGWSELLGRFRNLQKFRP